MLKKGKQNVYKKVGNIISKNHAKKAEIQKKTK